MKSNVSHQIFAQTKSHCHVSEIKIPELKVKFQLYLEDTLCVPKYTDLLLIWDFSLYEMFLLKDITSVFFINSKTEEDIRKIDFAH